MLFFSYYGSMLLVINKYITSLIHKYKIHKKTQSFLKNVNKDAT